MSLIYKRQEELYDLDQVTISQLSCLILGTTKLGTNIVNNLLKFGVENVTLINMDKFNEKNITHYNFNETRVKIIKIDSLKNWDVIVKEITNAHIVFNAVNYGDYFNVAVCKIAEKYYKPVVTGYMDPFFGRNVSYFLQGILQKDPLYVDCHDVEETKFFSQFVNFELYDDISFLPKDCVPNKCTINCVKMCSILMISAGLNYCIHLKNKTHPDPPKQCIFKMQNVASNLWIS